LLWRIHGHVFLFETSLQRRLLYVHMGEAVVPPPPAILPLLELPIVRATSIVVGRPNLTQTTTGEGGVPSASKMQRARTSRWTSRLPF
jgi:hypothetical protein